MQKMFNLAVTPTSGLGKLWTIYQLQYFSVLKDLLAIIHGKIAHACTVQIQSQSNILASLVFNKC